MKRVDLPAIAVSLTFCLTGLRTTAGESPDVLKELVRHEARVNALVFSSDGKRLASGCSAGIIRVMDVTNGTKLLELNAHSAKAIGRHHQNSDPPRGVLALAFSKDGQTIFSGGSDGHLHAWNIQTRAKHTLIDDQFVCAIALAPGGAAVASAGYGSDIRIIDLSTRRVRKLKGASERVTSVLYSADGKTLYTGGVTVNETFPNCPVIESDWIRTWDVATGKEGVHLSAKAHRLAAVADDSFVSSGAVLRLETGPKAIGQIQFDDTSLSIRVETSLWQQSKKRWTLYDHGDVAVAPASARFLATAPSELFFEVGVRGGNSLGPDVLEQKTLVFDVATRQLVMELPVSGAGALAFSPRGRHLAVADDKGRVSVVDLESAQDAFLNAMTPAQLWNNLAEKSWSFCHRSMWQFGLGDKATLELFSKKLLGPIAKDVDKIQKAIANLGSDVFKTREAAFNELSAIGGAAVPQVRKALSAGPPLEIARRLEKLLERYDEQAGVSPADSRRNLRAVKVLEDLNTTESRALLREIADRTPYLAVHDAAQEALARK